MFDCQAQTQLFDDRLVTFAGEDIEFNFSFDGRVRRAAVAIQSFDLHYIDTDHYVKDVRISASCDESYEPSRDLNAKVNVLLKDKDNTRRIKGAVTLVAMVDRDPAYVLLRCLANNRYLCALNGGGAGVVVDREDGREWETFEVTGLLESGRSVSFRTADGLHYLASPTGQQPLNAQAAWAKECETFRIYHAPGFSAPDGRVGELNHVVLETSEGYLAFNPRTGHLLPVASDPSNATVFEIHVL